MNKENPMEPQNQDEAIRQNLLPVMEETLHSHQGMFTEPGTSLLETLADIDADRASRCHPPHSQTIAGHAFHAGYYLKNSLDMLTGRTNGDFSVAESWQKTQVSAEQWVALREGLEEVYAEVMRHIVKTTDWTTNGQLAVVVAMVAHSAYHLGAIRQLKDL